MKDVVEYWSSTFEPGSIDLILTSPPYAQKRRSHYPGISENDYPNWTCRWMEAARPYLKPSASVAIVIRSHVDQGAISPYVLKTRLALYELGWREPEELIWQKPTAPPVGHKVRPRRSWEHILWFSPSAKQVYCNPKANGKMGTVGMELRHHKKQMSLGVFVPYATEEVPGWTRCTDVISVGTGECHRERWNTHPAQYPPKLTDWVIRLMCPEGGLVVDPFCGSGTTLVSAHGLGRRFAGSDVVPEYLEIAKRRLSEAGYAASDSDSGSVVGGVEP